MPVVFHIPEIEYVYYEFSADFSLERNSFKKISSNPKIGIFSGSFFASIPTLNLFFEMFRDKPKCSEQIKNSRFYVHSKVSKKKRKEKFLAYEKNFMSIAVA